MTKQEIIETFEENYFIATDGTVKIYADDLVEIFTKHETDLLKEFVEYVQNEYNQIEQYFIKQIEELPRRQIKDRDTLQVVEEKVIDEDKKKNLLQALDALQPILIEVRKALPVYLEDFIKERGEK